MLGRCLAWRAARAGARVALYDASNPSGEGCAAWAAAGMIAPTAEGAEVDPQIVQMGRHSLGFWPQWLAELPLPVFNRDTGTLVVGHRFLLRNRNVYVVGGALVAVLLSAWLYWYNQPPLGAD